MLLGEVKSFVGNQTHSDHFKLLRQDGGSLLLGARNIVYNISLPDLQVQIQTFRYRSRPSGTDPDIQVQMLTFRYRSWPSGTGPDLQVQVQTFRYISRPSGTDPDIQVQILTFRYRS